MTEDDAQIWVNDRFGHDAFERLSAFATMVVSENAVQNLISPASCDHIWVRHLVDSAQLALLAPRTTSTWIDIGTGAGFPGLVIAALSTSTAVTLVEPRAKRADFLRHAASDLALANVNVIQAKAEGVAPVPYDVVSARAVTSLEGLLTITSHLRHAGTRMILPRGRNGATEVEGLSRRWRGMFHVEQSITDATSAIIVADGVAC